MIAVPIPDPPGGHVHWVAAPLVVPARTPAGKIVPGYIWHCHAKAAANAKYTCTLVIRFRR